MRCLLKILSTIMAMASVPPAFGLLFSPILLKPALLFSPLLLKASRLGITVRYIGTSPRSDIDVPPQISDADCPPVLPDFHDDDLMRYKHALLSKVYEKSLDRCFIGSDGTCSFLSID